MFVGGDLWRVCCRRFRDTTMEDLDALTLDGMRSAFNRLLHPQNLEVGTIRFCSTFKMHFASTSVPLPNLIVGRSSLRYCLAFMAMLYS